MLDRDERGGGGSAGAPGPERGGGAASAGRQPATESDADGGGASPGSPQSLLPAVSLPKGGGAIRGIGEKVTVNGSTGTASLSIPLPASPGRQGQAPAVSLSYSSGAGASSFGLGFQLSVPTITRKTDRGIPRYVDDAESDTYVLSQAEDLVPVLNEQGERLFVERDGHRAYRYRPRIEGLFARIERWVNDTTRDVHWRVTTKDNVTHVYGTASASRIQDPESDEHVFTWLLEKTEDDRGNITRYEYKAEDGVGVDPTRVSERSRFDYSGATPVFTARAQKHLERVRYGNAAPYVDGDFLFELVFDYGGHAALPEPDETAAGWAVREDPFSTYHPGFEVRTYRLCRRVLMFHRLNAARTPLFVRATELAYQSSPVVTYLARVTQAGYLFDADTSSWVREEMPSLELTYQEPELHDELSVLSESSLEGLAGGTDGRRKQWVDLNGEGVAGVLIDQGGSWSYKENLGGGVLGAPRQVRTLPAPGSLAGGMQKLEDLDGDGRLELVSYEQPWCGYFERTTADGFDALRHFQALPRIDWNDPNLRFIDLDGDGHADLLITEDQAFVWYRSRAKEGFEPAERVVVPFDENEGPRVVFANSEQTIQLADMSGDGLVDIVRVRNGEVCYWPNLGHGRFGAKLTLENSPTFAHPEEFDASRVRFGDVDGSGTSDLFYAGRAGVTLYLNQSGNRLAEGFLIRALPPVDSAAQLDVVDLLGTGTSCLVWSSPLAHPTRTVLYVDLMNGTKPHLLKSIDNNLGATTTMTYASSTRFYLEDKQNGTPWLTRLPFPVQVVERMERFDAISGGRLVSRYRYRHGFFDGYEREFGGFARVEQRDAEEFPAEGDDPLLYQPPVRTVSWYHTGAWLEKERLELALQREYFQGGPPSLLLSDTVLPGALSVQDEREAARALKASLLRQEVYAEDGTDRAGLPYFITEQNQEVRLLQKSRGEDRYGVFFPFPRETVTISTEREVADWRLSHELILEVDDFGNATSNLAVAYGRGTGYDEQRARRATLSEATFVHQPEAGDYYRVGTEVERRVFEVTGLALPAAGGGLASVEALRTSLAGLDPASDLPFEALPTEGLLQRRLIDWKQQTFYTDTLSGEAALGSVGRRALPYETYQLALTTGHVAQLVSESQDLSGTPLDPNVLTSEGAYAARTGGYWAKSGHVRFDAAHFYLPVEAFDVFGARYQVHYDELDLLVVSATDPLGNIIQADNDYRVLAPRLVTDENLNRTAVAFDALGMVARMAVMGKTTELLGDTLENPTTQFEYDLLRWQEQRKPTFVHTIARELHAHEGPSTPLQHSYAYSDGFERIVMQKVQAEPGPAPLRNPDGSLQRDAGGELVLGHVDPRWVGTGRTVFNNKGNPVKRYEPFFSSTEEYESEGDLVSWGVTPIIHYDPLDRVIRTELPDGSESRVVYGAWHEEHWDANDTVLESAWYLERGSPDPLGPEPAEPERRAAWLAARHAETPTIIHLDTLGRGFLSIAHNRVYASGSPSDTHAQNRTALDIEGNVLGVTDALGVQTIDQRYDVLGRRIRLASADAGTRLLLPDSAGKPLGGWDARGQTQRHRYDLLQRPTHLYVQQGGNAPRLLVRTVYGEALDDEPPSPGSLGPTAAQALNLRGQPYRLYDCAGSATNAEFDFKKNLLESSRRLASDYQTDPDWIDAELLVAPGDIEAAVAALLETESFGTRFTYDALNRITSATTHDQSVTLPTYNKANLPRAVHVRLRGATQLTPIISHLDYNAKGQRTVCEYANGTASTYDYDARSLRLTTLRTLRSSPSAALQHLLYTYDPAGNITELRDQADWEPLLTQAPAVTGGGRYVYDALYRLVEAEGREHPAQQQTDAADLPRGSLPHPNDLQSLAGYTERYVYDLVGNIERMQHIPNPGSPAQGWARRYRYAYQLPPGAGVVHSNKLLATSITGDSEGQYSATYEHDAHGNMTRMPHLHMMDWDYADRLRHTRKTDGADPQDTYFTYDASGQRVRKVYSHSGLIEERIYLGGYELYRRRVGTIGAAPDEERQTLHVMDRERRAALLETKTRENGADVALPTTRYRFQLDNHLGSASLELDDEGRVISYEEYYPYGSTAFHIADGSAEVSAKRYRYTGKEKDDETGLYYHGARYYAPWLARWTAVEPQLLLPQPPEGDGSDEEGPAESAAEGGADGEDQVPAPGRSATAATQHAYSYCTDNPIVYHDPDGAAPRQFIGRIYVIKAEVGGKPVVYTGSTARELRARFSKHEWKSLIRAKSTEIQAYNVYGKLKTGGAAGTSLRAAKNQALRAAEQRIKNTMGKVSGLKQLNLREAATKANMAKWMKTHAVSVGRATVFKAAGKAFGVFSILDVYKTALELRMAEQGLERMPIYLEDEGGVFTVRYSGLLFRDYFKEYVSGPEQGKTVDISEEEAMEYQAESRALFGDVDWKGDFIPGLFAPEPIEVHTGPTARLQEREQRRATAHA